VRHLFSGAPSATSAIARAASALATGCSTPRGIGSTRQRPAAVSMVPTSSWNCVDRTMLHGTAPWPTTRSWSDLAR